MNVELRPRSLGENIGLTFQLTFRHLLKLVLVNGLVQLPLLVVQLAILFVEQSELLAGVALLGSVVILAILWPIGTGASTAIIAQSFTGKQVSVFDALGVSFRRLGSLFSYGIVTGLIVIGVPMLIAVPGIVLRNGLILLVAFLALAWPGLMFLTWYYVGNQSIIVEGKGFGTAMARSKELSEGKRIEIFALLLVVYLVAAMANGMFQGITMLLLLAGSAETAVVIPITVANWAFGVASGLFWTVAPVVMYFSLRCERDGMDVTSLADLVDRIGQRRLEEQ